MLTKREIFQSLQDLSESELYLIFEVTIDLINKKKEIKQFKETICNN